MSILPARVHNKGDSIGLVILLAVGCAAGGARMAFRMQLPWRAQKCTFIYCCLRRQYARISVRVPSEGHPYEKAEDLVSSGPEPPRASGGFSVSEASSKGTFWRDIVSLAVDILDLRAWSDGDPVAGFMVAAHVAAVAQLLVYGSLGNSIVALMTPVK